MRGERRPPVLRAAMADPGEKKYIKKKIRPGAIVLDPRETAIVVQYELEGQLLAPDGVTVITELSDGTKRIKVKTLDRRTDIQALADEIVTTCKLIHHSKTGKVRALLAELRDRVEASSGAKTRNEGLEIVHDDDERRERRNAAGRAGSRASSSARPISSTRKGTTTNRASRSRADDPTAKELDDIVQREDARLRSEARLDFLGAMHDVAAATRLVSGIGSSGLVSKLGALGLNATGGGLSSHATNDQSKKTNTLANLDLYLERLYDDDPKTRLECVEKIALLASRSSNLEALASHETLPQTLARVLREDGRRSTDVATHCLCVFFALSNASAFHGLILGNQVGDATLRVVDLELRRAADRRKTHLRTNAPRVHSNDSTNPITNTNDEDIADIADIDEFEARRVVLAENKRDALLYVAFYALLNVAEDVAVERKMKKRDICHYLMECVGTRGDVDLLVLCVTFLRKLSVRRENVEDMLRGATETTTKTTTEKKASDDGDPDGDALRSPSEEKKTPPFDVVSRTARFLADGDACVPDVLVSATLRLLLNLSFHERARDAMHERALLPRLCVLAKKKAFERVALATLYNLSVDKRRRRFFAVASPTAGTDLVLDALLETPDADLIAHACPIVAGLAVNLSCDARCAEALVARENGKPFVSFLKRRLMRRDALGLKVARNVARFAGDKETCPSVWRAFKQALVGDQTVLNSMLDCFLSEHPLGTDVALEALGLLADAHRPMVDGALDLSEPCESRGVFEKIAAYVTPNETEDDAALEAVLFCLAFGKGKENAKNARFFVRTCIVESLYETLREKKDDDAFVLAVVSAFGAFLSFPETRDVVLNHTQTVFYLVELLRDECAAIRDAADAALDVVVDEAGEKWAVHVRRARFEAHNREWLDACGGGGGGSGGGGSFDEHSAPVYDDRAEEEDMYGGY